jgi:hypothetical protein
MTEYAARASAVGVTLDVLERLCDGGTFSAETVLSSLEATARKTPEEWLAEINDDLGLRGDERLTAILRERTEGGGFVFVGQNGQRRVTERQLLIVLDARRAIMGATRALVPHMRRAEWEPIVRKVWRAATEIDLGAEATFDGRGREWLRSYLGNWQPVDDKNEAAQFGHPFRDNGRVHVVGSVFKRWIRHDRYEHLSDPEFGRIMRAAGCEYRQVHVTVGGKRTTISTWIVPDALETG